MIAVDDLALDLRRLDAIGLSAGAVVGCTLFTRLSGYDHGGRFSVREQYRIEVSVSSIDPNSNSIR